MALDHVKQALRNHSRMFSEIEGNIAYASKNQKLRNVFVTSCNDQEGKSSASVIMACALSSQANSSVLLIEGNFYAPVLHSFFETPAAPGLFDFLRSSDQSLDNYAKKTAYQNLFYLPLGNVAKNEGFQVLRNYREKIIKATEGKYQYVIYDGPSAFGSSDTYVLSQGFDGVIIVLECERTRWEVLEVVKDKIQQVGGHILGVILNKRKYYIPKDIYEKF